RARARGGGQQRPSAGSAVPRVRRRCRPPHRRLPPRRRGGQVNVGSVFSGCGLLDYGLHLAGFDHAWLCERDEFRAQLLEQRWPGIPVYRDIRDVDARAARVDLVAGGFPCKGASTAGRRAGFGHPETALWREMLRVVRELRPRYVLVENVADLLAMRPPGGRPGDLAGEVFGGTAESGYATGGEC